MKALRFRLAAWRNDDNLLARRSAMKADLLAELGGKRVAIVGNARALANTDQGAAIEAADLIIRINRAPMPNPRSHGSRTDWLALATSLPRDEYEALGAQRLLWMSHKRKRLRLWMAQTAGYYLSPARDFNILAARLNARPTTGALVIQLVADSAAGQIDLHGFDFFASRSLSGARDASAVPHDFNAEGAWVDRLLRDDPRVTLHQME